MLEQTVSIERLRGWCSTLAAVRDVADRPDEELLALIESCERLKDACAAAQARATNEYADRRLAGLEPGSRDASAARRDIGGRIARARQVSPAHGGRYLELARVLGDLPRTLAALAAGQTNEYRAGLIAHAAGCLSAPHRAVLDARIGPHLNGKGDRAVQAEADGIAAELDAAAVLERHRRAITERRVTLRPAPDTMTYLTALLPVADGVATWTALDRFATLASAAGDRRSRGQIMADELAHRLLHGTTSEPTVPAGAAGSGVPTGPGPLPRDLTDGHGPAAAPPDGRIPSGVPPTPGTLRPAAGPDGRPSTSTQGPTSPASTGRSVAEQSIPPDDRAGGVGDGLDDTRVRPVEQVGAARPAVRQIDLMLVMTDRALLDGADTPAVLPGHGPVPAALARGLLADADPATRVFVRRLYTDPTGDQLLSADARGRLFPYAMRRFVLARDQRCRNPWCDAPVRHIDHTVPHATGGPTDLSNTSGLCARCNLSKAAHTDPAVQPGPPPPPPRSPAWGSPPDRLEVPAVAR